MSVWTMVGGPVFWILALLGAASIFVFLSRLMNLRRAQIDYQDFMRGVATVLEQHNPDEALAICDDTPAPVARIVAAAVRHRDQSARVLRETVVTTASGILLGIGLGTGLGYAIVRALEPPFIQFDRSVSVIAWLLAAVMTVFFTVVINAVVLRQVKQLKLTDVA